MVRYWPMVLVSLIPLSSAGCTPWRTAQPQTPLPLSDSITPTRIDYVDTDAFDVVLENSLKNQDAAIIIQTTHQKPDWGDRLNAWIAAWNMAGRTSTGEKFRMQAPLVPKVTVDGDSIREFRLLVESLMDRLDVRARQGLMWLSEERVKNRRVSLLKPYNLRFHMDGDGNIQIILFHGRYAPVYQEFVGSLAAADAGDEWQRKLICSLCASRKPTARPTSSGSEPE
jgi:hypothetical protein